ncbi:MAG: hypothetical protein ACOX2F_07145 [bacterium]
MNIHRHLQYLQDVLARRRSYGDFSWYWDNTTPFHATFYIDTNWKIIALPLASNFNYFFEIDWGDGKPLEVVEKSNYNAQSGINQVTHQYNNAGTYTIKVVGVMPLWRFGVSAYEDFRGILTAINDWGQVGYGATAIELRYMFHDCVNLVSVPPLDVKHIADFEGIFNNCSSLNVGALLNVQHDIDYSDCPLPTAQARNDIYTGLAEVTGKMITMPSPIYDENTNIATAKGWAVKRI